MVTAAGFNDKLRLAHIMTAKSCNEDGAPSTWQHFLVFAGKQSEDGGELSVYHFRKGSELQLKRLLCRELLLMCVKPWTNTTCASNRGMSSRISNVAESAFRLVVWLRGGLPIAVKTWADETFAFNAGNYHTFVVSSSDRTE